LKLTAPGVPDLYQGTDLWDFSLVDPDNRRPVDFALRREIFAELQRGLEAGNVRELAVELLKDFADGRIKLFVIRQALRFRRQHTHLFRDGSYAPLLAKGRQAEHVCAFVREHDGATAVTVVPRLVLGLTGGHDRPPVGEAVWNGTRLVLPRGQAGRPFRNVFTTEVLCAREDGANASLRLADMLGKFPVALFEMLDTPA
jgi:(1->4)-alpha-D-glucan 1-alpha-D-glucosylmutase